MRSPFPSKSLRGFTLVELLAVIAIMAILVGLSSSAFQSISGANSLTKNASDIAGTLEQARAYAMGNSTYVYVGLQEISSPQSSSSGIGRVAVAVVASADGTRPYLDSPGQINTSGLVAVARLQYFDNLHLTSSTSLTSGGMANRPSSSLDGFIDLSSITSSVTFQWPLTGSTQYTFSKVIEIDPQGVARIQSGSTFNPTIPSYIEIPLLPTHGGAVLANNANQAAIQVDGMTGSVSTYRP